MRRCCFLSCLLAPVFLAWARPQLPALSSLFVETSPARFSVEMLGGKATVQPGLVSYDLRGTVFALSFESPEPASPQGTGRCIAVFNDLRPGFSRRGRAYSGVQYDGVFPGIAIQLANRSGHMEFDYVVSPGARPEDISLRYLGLDSIFLAPDGALGLVSPAGLFTDSIPAAYQDIGGRRVFVRASFVVRDDGSIGFRVGAYDSRHTLVIDPAIGFSYRLGGGSVDQPTGITQDGAGNIYLCGWTDSADFPNAPRTEFGVDAVVVKLDPTGTAVLAVTRFGGHGDDRANAIALDRLGRIWIAGSTYSSDFAVLSHTQIPLSGVSDGFVACLSAETLGITYTSYIGGTGVESVNAIAVNFLGDVFVAGDSSSSRLSQQFAPVQARTGAGTDAFVAHLNSSGSLDWYRFLGGSLEDRAFGLASDWSGDIYVAGSTFSPDFPVQNAFQAVRPGAQSGWVAKLNGLSGSVVYSSYIGGSAGSAANPECALAIAADAGGAAFVAGVTSSPDFPVVAPLQRTFAGTGQAFLAKVTPTGGTLGYSTFLGGSAMQAATSLRVEPTGAMTVAGWTTSWDYPLQDPAVVAPSGAFDAFVTRLSPDGSALEYSTYLGPLSGGGAVAMTSSGPIMISGASQSPSIPALFSASASTDMSYSVLAVEGEPGSGAMAYTSLPYGSLGVTYPAINVLPAGAQKISLTGLLPPGTTVDTAGVLSGMPTVSGQYRFAVGVQYADGTLGSIRYLLVINQAGCSVRVQAPVPSLTAGVPNTATLSIIAGVGCFWDAYSVDSWVALNAGIGLGSGYLQLSAASNPGASRTATLQIAGQAYSITQAGPGDVSAGLLYIPVSPCRAVDTRKANGPFGGPAISGGSSRAFTLPASGCGIPTSAKAYAVNVTGVPQGPLGYLTVWPAGQAMPTTSTLNSLDGRVKANAAIVAAGQGGAVNIFVSNSSDVVLDVNGYFVSAKDEAALAFYPLTPCRIADTRLGVDVLGGPSLTGGLVRTFPVRASVCNVPAAAQAYALNLTAVPKGPLGYLTAWPTGQPLPTVSTLNAHTGALTANAAVLPAGMNGSIDVFASNSSDLVIDIAGYFAPPGSGALSLYTSTPCRVIDTRLASPTGPFTGPRTVTVTASSCNVPSTARAYVMNATAVPSGPLGYLTIWPAGTSMPAVSTLNSLDGTIASNMLIAASLNGSVAAFVSNPSQLILDIFGYFAP